jgi:hypothetical protein
LWCWLTPALHRLMVIVCSEGLMVTVLPASLRSYGICFEISHILECFKFMAI